MYHRLRWHMGSQPPDTWRKLSNGNDTYDLVKMSIFFYVNQPEAPQKKHTRIFFQAFIILELFSDLFCLKIDKKIISKQKLRRDDTSAAYFPLYHALEIVLDVWKTRGPVPLAVEPYTSVQGRYLFRDSPPSE